MADILKRAAVLGASGYTGAEAVRLIVGHPRLYLPISDCVMLNYMPKLMTVVMIIQICLKVLFMV